MERSINEFPVGSRVSIDFSFPNPDASIASSVYQYTGSIVAQKGDKIISFLVDDAQSPIDLNIDTNVLWYQILDSSPIMAIPASGKKVPWGWIGVGLGTLVFIGVIIIATTKKSKKK